jgi:hypothetical protein
MRTIASAFRLLAIVFCLSLAFPHRASAATTPLGFENLDIGQICPQSGPVSKYLLARSLLKGHSIPIDMIDWNNTGIGTEQYVQAVTKVLCRLTPLNPAQKKMCFGDGTTPEGQPPQTSDNVNQTALVLGLNSTLTPLIPMKGPHRGFDIVLGKATLHFLASPVAGSDEQRLNALAPNAPPVEKVFSSDPKYFDISCSLTPPAKPAPPGPVATNGPPAATNAPKGDQPPLTAAKLQAIADSFRLRGKPEDLGIGRDSDAFAGVSSATLSTVNDLAAQKNTFDAHMTLGYFSTPIDQQGITLASTPFLQYDRDYVDGGKAPPNSSNVNNIGLGIQERLTFPVGGIYGSLFLQPEYITSLRNNAELVKFRLAYEADPLVPFIGFAAPTIVPGFWATAYARAVVNVFDVTKPANDKSLTSKSSFTQGGTELGVTYFVNDDGSLLKGLSIPITYTGLYGFSGPYKSVELFTGTISYTLPKTKYVTVGLSYTSGRNLDTFELQKVYKASLGLKY